MQNAKKKSISLGLRCKKVAFFPSFSISAPRRENCTLHHCTCEVFSDVHLHLTTVWLRQDFIKSRNRSGWREGTTQGSQSGRDIVHQPLHLLLMSCLRQPMLDCVFDVCTSSPPPTPTPPTPHYSFMSEYQRAAQCQCLANGFSNPLVFAGRSFNPLFWDPGQKCT